jgi:hypothetical protein
MIIFAFFKAINWGVDSFKPLMGPVCALSKRERKNERKKKTFFIHQNEKCEIS